LRYLFADCALDTDRRELRRVSELVSLTPQVFDLLDCLVRNRERVISKDELVASIWGGRAVSDSAITTRINAARAAIGDDGKTQRMIKTLPRKGFRFVGVVREELNPAAPASTETALHLPRPALALPDKPSVAVLSFDNLHGDPGRDYFSDGITEDIITQLSRFSELFVIARNSSFQYKRKSIDVRQIGRELGVRYVLEGSIRRQGNRGASQRSLSMPRPALIAGPSATIGSSTTSLRSRTSWRGRSPRFWSPTSTRRRRNVRC
jgi:DNA-binding winged helix-turn-helix (wHTH) protein